MELAEGLILDGHYRLRQLLGRGGMGEVWEAEHTRLPKLFALKFLLALSKTEPELLMRFQREAEIASRLNHPSIVQVTDFNILPDGTAYIAMERLVGEDLRARLRRGPITLAEAREIIRQVSSALQLAHEQGIVHRDLKPENIFLCREPDGSLRAKLLDFGISKLQGSLQGTRDDRVLGTPGYMAPEQALGKNSAIDGRTDVFALATILYEMLTGEGVFVGDTLAELCTKVLFHEPPPLTSLLPGVPKPISQAVSVALSKEPTQRQPSIRAFSDELLGITPARATSGFAATLAPDIQPKGPVPIDVHDVKTRSERPQPASPSTPARRSRLLSALGGASIVALVIALVAWREVRAPRAQPVTSAPAPSEPAAAPPQQAEPVHTETTPPPSTGVEPPPPEGTHVDNLLTVKRPERALDPGALRKPELSAAARESLAAADQALAQGQHADALRLARASLRDGPSERAYALMARAYCGQRDLGMVQAMLRNLSPTVRKQVKAQCAQAGLELP